MKISRLLPMGRLFCRNMLLKEFPISPADARGVLAEYWQDADASCRESRPAQWQEASVDLSVILPCYNDAAHICRGMDSVLNQKTEYTMEVIAVNDGSTDASGALLKKYEGLPNVTVIHQENQGLSGARNTGLARCRGRYILFHDSDDVLLPGSVQNLLSAAFSHEAELVAGGYLDESPEGVRSPGLRYSAEELPAHAISGMACGKVYRRSLFSSVKFPEGYWYEDSVVSQILIPTAKSFRCILPEVFACLQNAAGISATSQGKPKSLDSLYITERLLKDRALFGLPATPEAYRHFLYMVILTFQRTQLLEPRAVYAVFQHQRYLKKTFFPGCSQGTALEKALEAGNYRSYLWNCQLGWLKQLL